MNSPLLARSAYGSFVLCSRDESGTASRTKPFIANSWRCFSELCSVLDTTSIGVMHRIGVETSSAFDKLGFKIKYDPTVNYGGCFNAHERTITLRFVGDNTIYHEMGHFLAFVAGNVDRSSDFAAIYNSEKSKFTGINRSYATQNATEYFAESYHDYILQPTETKKKLPKTCSAISDAVKKVTPTRVARVKEIYGPFWK